MVDAATNREADWLLAGQETGYTILIDPPVMFEGIRTLVDDVIADQPGASMMFGLR